MNDDFSRVLSRQMEYYSTDPNADSMTRMRGEIDQVLDQFPGSSGSWRLQLKHHRKLNKEKSLIVWTVWYSLLLQVRGIMLDNIDKVLERGDRLELLVDKTATMEGNTMRFKRQARRFRNTMWWRNVKLTYVPHLLALAYYTQLRVCIVVIHLLTSI